MRVLKEDKNPEVIVITPLLPGHKVSKDTKKTIKRNKTHIVWILSESKSNIPTNVQNGLSWYRKRTSHLPQYLLPLDRDIILGRYMIDRMVNVMNSSSDRIAYVYANFEFKGTVNREFPAKPYDINTLVFNNYISSNSLINIDKLDEIGGFVTDDKYKRLLDWCLWLKFYHHGYIGRPCINANFVAISTEDDISAGTARDFELKRKVVMEDFVRPIISNVKEDVKPSEDNDIHQTSPGILTFDEL